MKSLSFHSSRRGMALVVILGVILILTIMAVGLSTIMRTERAVARNNLDSVQARAFAEMAVDNATGLIRTAIEAGSAQDKFWSSQGGRVTVFNANGSVDATASRDLFSQGSSGSAVNLNQTSFSGKSPIATASSVGSGSAPPIEAQWVEVLDNPSNPASADNKITGRYAFWVDDETSKININTADGSAKYTSTWYGSGTPADISLESLKLGGTDISSSQAASIANQTGIKSSGASTTPRYFNSQREISKISGAGSALFEENNFSLTHLSLAPELNIFGEPRIPLTVSRSIALPSGTTVNNIMTGDYDYKGVGTPGAATIPIGRSLTQIYPSSSQLPLMGSGPLPQTFKYEESMDNQRYTTASPDYEMGYRIARYLKGYNSAGTAIQWPTFPGSGSGFADKYTDRQIDSITLQILSLMKRSVMADHFRSSSLAPIMGKGWLSGKPVKGVGRTPKLNEILVIFSATPGVRKLGSTSYNVAEFSVRIYLEWYLPKEYAGYDLTTPYDATSASGFRIGFDDSKSYLNCVDAPGVVNDGDPGALGGYWMDNLLVIQDGAGAPAGIDLYGNGTSNPDPDQAKASAYHPWRRKTDGTYTGAGPGASVAQPALRMGFRLSDQASAVRWKVGEYHCVGSHNNVLAATYPSKPNVTELKIKGGLTIWARSASGSPAEGFNLDPVPLDSIRGPAYTGEDYASIKSELLEAVIPMPAGLTIPVPGQVTIHYQVADPLVNSMPGDWVVTVNPPASQITMQIPSTDTATHYMNGENVIAKASAGGDPKANWLPTQAADITKNQRFPSVGALQYIRTGMMPDKAKESLPLSQQHGTSFRMLNFSPSSSPSQATDGGGKYPDWAMLDLFTVPAALQPLGGGPQFDLTAGGATAGRLNPNSPKLPSGTTSRTTPLEALFDHQEVYRAVNDTPAADVVDEVALAKAVKSYIDGLGRPLMMAGEICNVPEIADYVYQGVGASARSRNDLVRQIVGNLTTRSNTFTIWAVGQTVRKKTGNTQYGKFEAGDTVTGEARYEVLIERYLDLGIDGVAGNSANPGPDGIIGTPDDPVDAQYHPSMTYPLPYKYRVVQARQIVN